MKKTLALPLLGGLLTACAGSVEPPTAAASEGLPPGFELAVFAEGLERPRFMSFGPDGTLYVGSNRDRVYALPDRNRDGRADAVIVFASGLHSPHSVFWHTIEPPGDFITPKVRPKPASWLYVGETHRVIRLRDTDGDLRADEQEVVVPNLPAGQQHFTRTVGFGPDGGLYVSVGSSCNVCREEDERRAVILRFEANGSGGQIYARGLRNAVGFTWHPETRELWATDNGRDWLGDDLPPEELDRVQRGDDHGWPDCYGQRLPDPDMGSPERCARTVPATFEMPAHTAPLGLDFYTGTMFPRDYWGDLFIALHGSWNRSVPIGYKVIRVRFRDGKPAAMEDFADVWFKGGRVRHRPVDVKTGPDGALYISDDRGGTIFRVTYKK
ncbi:MAG: sorbosone dehydrogenase family protein [Acidobacteria bacterium]|nr:sorbosone dehydrogenase family protein [Acidobacteriota bacterium]